MDTIGTNAHPRRPVLRWHPALSDHGPVWLILLACALVWTALPSLLQLAPHADNVEQLNWSHSYQWGYFKHPPLPTWLLRTAIGLFGPSAVLTYALAMTCVGLALWLLWLCARQVLEPRAALVALLFSTANYYLMGRGSFLNHNTVMLPFVALSTWAVLRIVAGAGWSMWLLLGLAQALGLLTKYQMALTVMGNLAALLWVGAHRQPRFGRHLTLAGAVTVLPLVPHAVWLSGHDFGTMQNFSHSLLAHLGPVERLRACLGFLGQQVARLAPALLAVLLARWIGPSSLLRSYGGLRPPSAAAQQPKPAEGAVPTEERRAPGDRLRRPARRRRRRRRVVLQEIVRALHQRRRLRLGVVRIGRCPGIRAVERHPRLTGHRAEEVHPRQRRRQEPRRHRARITPRDTPGPAISHPVSGLIHLVIELAGVLTAGHVDSERPNRSGSRR